MTITKLMEAEITLKARGTEFEFVKLYFSNEKNACTLKFQEVLFGDMQVVEIGGDEFNNLVKLLSNCKVPFPNYVEGSGGTSNTIDITSGKNTMVYEWLNESPGEQWKDLFAVKQFMIDLKNKYQK